MSLTKKCTNCEKEKPIEEFHKDKGRKDGRYTHCKVCAAAKQAESRKDKPLKHIVSTYKEGDTKQCVHPTCGKVLDISNFRNDRSRSDGKYPYCKKCQTGINNKWMDESEKGQALGERYRKSEKNVARAREYAKGDVMRTYRNTSEYRESVKRASRKRIESGKQAASEKHRTDTNIQYRITQRLRSRIHSALKGNTKLKCGRSLELLAMPIAEYKVYIESLWQDGMHWGNYSKDGWVIDHKRPCISFDLTDPEQQKACFIWSNTRPLWASENSSKGGKYDPNNPIL